MKRLLTFALLLCSTAVAQFTVPFARRVNASAAVQTVAGTPSGDLWSVVQYTPNFITCTQAFAGDLSCPVTTSAIGSGHLLIASVECASDDSGGYTTNVSTVHNAGAWSTDANTTNSPYSLYYILNSGTAGDTSVSFNCTGSWYGDGSFTTLEVAFIEVSRSSGTAVKDTSNKVTRTCSSCAGPSLTLTGTKDFILQLGYGTISAPYSKPVITGGAIGTPVPTSIAGAQNVTSYSAPTWTTGSSASRTFSAIAFK